MARCPACQHDYGPEVLCCPRDGQSLVLLVMDEMAAGPPPGATGLAADVAMMATGIAPSLSGPGGPVPSMPTASGGHGLIPGTAIGEYLVQDKIGEGGMGTVYSGIHPVIGKKVAIKLLNPGLSQDPQVVQRFVQEARAVNQIGHPGIVDIFAFGQLPDGRHYCVMELLPGETLSERLGRGEPLSYREAFTVLFAVCDALAAAHEQGIVHRDLKPENILLCEGKSGPGAVKLLDFGVAKLTRADGPISHTQTGVAIGTPLYMSPEQCVGRGVGTHSDVYSLGVIMFEVFTGKQPFRAASFIETVNQHLNAPVPDPTRMVEIPSALGELITECLAKDPAARPASIEVIHERMTTIVNALGSEVTRPTGSHPPLAPAVTPRPASVPPELARSGGGATSLTGRRQAATQALGPAAAIAPPTAQAPHTPRRRTRLILLGALAVGLVGLGAVGATLFGRHRPARPAAMVGSREAVARLQVVTDPPGAVVFIDGKREALRAPNVFFVTRPSTLNVRVELPGFKPYEERVTFGDLDPERAVVTTLVSRAVAGAQLSVRTGVEAGSWTLDDKPVGNGTGKLRLDNLAPGTYRVAIEAPGHQRFEEQVELKPLHVVSLSWNLVPLGDDRAGKEPRETRDGRGRPAARPAAAPATPAARKEAAPAAAAVDGGKALASDGGGAAGKPAAAPAAPDVPPIPDRPAAPGSPDAGTPAAGARPAARPAATPADGGPAARAPDAAVKKGAGPAAAPAEKGKAGEKAAPEAATKADGGAAAPTADGG